MFTVRFYISFALSLVLFIGCLSLSSEYFGERYEQNPPIKRLQEYIQIDTTDSKNIELVVQFWRRQAKELGLPFAVYRPRKIPICVLTMKGNRPDLPSIMLNSHADVVPAFGDAWTYPPFSGHIDDKGNLYGRGSQDTKDIAIQYLEAIRKLIRSNVTLDRTIHITVMPDEETGGLKGMTPFVETENFKSLNIGFVFDEGLTSQDNVMLVLYQDKRPWQTRFIIHGNGGHGSKMASGTAIEGVQKLLNRVTEYRNEQLVIMNSKNASDYGDYTTININMIEGGVAPNVIPTNVSVVIDMRLSVDADVNSVQNMLNSWLAELDSKSKIEFIRRVDSSPATAVNESNPYWMAIQKTMKELGIPILPVVCPAASDMMVIRRKGIPALGFTTKTYMTPKLHNVDEYIALDKFLKGIDIYVALLKNIGNLPESR